MSRLSESNPQLAWIFIGSSANAKDRNWLRNNDIKYILNVTNRDTFNDGVANFHAKDPELIYERIPLADKNYESITPYLETAWQFFDLAMTRGDGNLLVHCKRGRSRSAAILVSFLMKYMRMAKSDAEELLSSVRRIRINPAYLKGLEELEQRLLETKAYAPLVKPRSQSTLSSISRTKKGPMMPCRPLEEKGEEEDKCVVFGPIFPPSAVTRSQKDKPEIGPQPAPRPDEIECRPSIGPTLPPHITPSQLTEGNPSCPNSEESVCPKTRDLRPEREPSSPQYTNPPSDKDFAHVCPEREEVCPNNRQTALAPLADSSLGTIGQCPSPKSFEASSAESPTPNGTSESPNRRVHVECVVAVSQGENGSPKSPSKRRLDHIDSPQTTKRQAIVAD